MSSATIFLVFLLYKTFSISLTFSWRKFACHFVCSNLNCAFIVFVKDQQRFQLQDMDDAAECLVSKYREYNSCSVLIVFNHPFVNCMIIWICHLFHRLNGEITVNMVPGFQNLSVASRCCLHIAWHTVSTGKILLCNSTLCHSPVADPA